ncbi:hypothetical protein CBL_01057 [Carabus blaptoides fortunei]
MTGRRLSRMSGGFRTFQKLQASSSRAKKNRSNMRIYVLYSLLAVAVNARPQTNTTSQPVEPQQIQNHSATNQQTRTYKTNAAIRDSVQHVANQLADMNATVDFTRDTRTPPKIKLQHRNMERKKQEAIENSHPGIAVPLDVDTFLETATQKRPSFVHRNEHKTPATTDSGISTWILLSGQSTTAKPLRKQPTTTEKTVKVKPITTRKPKTTTAPAATSTVKAAVETKASEKSQQMNNKILTKIKASMLTSAVKNKTTDATTIAPQTTISVTTAVNAKKTNEVDVETNDLQPESKDGGIERKPAAEKNANSTKIGQKEKPFGTQIYNYLSREVMPTVGVGLVGLVVTAGLASYFLYPFGGLRRAYDNAVDRKDYHYDEYAAGGIKEEELIGKVIAGMPEQTVYPHSYRSSLARKEANRNNYRTSDPYFSHYPHRDFQTVSVGSKLGYGRDVVVEHQKESGYTVDDGEMKSPLFVVGNVPKDFEQPVTPITVPEHGPRSLRTRRRAQNVEENEVIDYKTKTSPSIYENKYVTDSSAEDTSETPQILEERPSFFSFVRNLLEIKVRMGLDFLLNATDKFSGYLRGVQRRVDNVFREQKSRIR